jgi:hypothetical protein
MLIKHIDLQDPAGRFLIAVRAQTPSSNVEEDVDGTGQDLWDVGATMLGLLQGHARAC